MTKLVALALITLPSLALAGDAPPKVAPKPAAELKELAGSIQGTWRCTGKATVDGAQIDMKATISNRSDVDGFWIQTNLTATMGKQSYKFTGFTGYNSSENKFYRYMVDNIGGAEWNTATSINHGMADKWAIDWEGEQRLDMGAPPPSKEKDPARAQAIDQARKAGILGTAPVVVKTKHSESFSKEGLAIKGEMSTDGGKTWVTAYDALCKK
jgi:uncharacterized protein DUF1579